METITTAKITALFISIWMLLLPVHATIFTTWFLIFVLTFSGIYKNCKWVLKEYKSFGKCFKFPHLQNFDIKKIYNSIVTAAFFLLALASAFFVDTHMMFDLPFLDIIKYPFLQSFSTATGFYLIYKIVQNISQITGMNMFEWVEKFKDFVVKNKTK